MSNLRVSASIGVLLLVGVGAVQQATKPAPVTHDLAGRDNCLMCHTAGAMEPVPDVPASHAADADIQTADPPAIAHDTAGRDNCLMCHTPGAMEPVPDVPASHEGRGIEHCGMCHKPAG